MNGREYFHESVVRDIVDVLTSLKDYDEVQFINNSNANSLKFNDSTTKSFNFGEKMLTHYIKNNLATQILIVIQIL